jgi:hypothetical protein
LVKLKDWTFTPAEGRFSFLALYYQGRAALRIQVEMGHTRAVAFDVKSSHCV